MRKRTSAAAAPKRIISRDTRVCVAVFLDCQPLEVRFGGRCLSLTGLPFMGAMLKVGRPSKYEGPMAVYRGFDSLTRVRILQVQ